ncbi:hypothetical protein H8B22_12740 [Lysobacter terrestris]|uniref:Beta-barrel assembly machine subunit BamC n=2 Tax=Agrilutibacter terrestris TaxID=2865112 RepID=A0A7H0FWB9_9GAMM|nr:hypothetical protein [Lysobacter terrestris]QNP40335.1 hypothetical protein H8B22_12740 [Lysobacter terrestris]
MRLTRYATIALVSAALLATSGCSWFRKEDKLYAGDANSRPLEVPPDLDMPRTDGAVAIPGASATASASASAAPVAGVSNGFTVAGSRDDAFTKVGDALATMDGLTIASRAQLLGVYDVGYEGSNFLVRVSTVEAGAYVAAVDPRGQPATGEAAVKAITALKAALGGN